MLQQFTAGRSLADKVAQQLVETTDRLCRKFAPAGGAAAEVVRGQVTAGPSRLWFTVPSEPT
jgi:hypothetical protein